MVFTVSVCKDTEIFLILKNMFYNINGENGERFYVKVYTISNYFY